METASSDRTSRTFGTGARQWRRKECVLEASYFLPKVLHRCQAVEEERTCTPSRRICYTTYSPGLHGSSGEATHREGGQCYELGMLLTSAKFVGVGQSAIASTFLCWGATPSPLTTCPR
eukprot:8382348-Pyramimonas_sp.AAC.1